MYEGKKNSDKWFPVVLLDSTDFKTAKTGIAFGSATVKYSFEAGTSLTTYSLTTADWKEAGEGKYWVRIGASEFTSEGKYEVSVAAAASLTYNFAVEVRDKMIAEMMDDVDTLLTRISGNLTISGGAVNANVTSWAGSATTKDANNLPDVNAKAISADTAAADNLEAVNDGTGGTATYKSTARAPIIIEPGDGNYDGISVVGAGTGSALSLAGGLIGHAVKLRGGATSGRCIDMETSGTVALSECIKAVSNNDIAVHIKSPQGSGGKAALTIVGGNAGTGAILLDSTTSGGGSALKIASIGSGLAAVEIVGSGTCKAVSLAAASDINVLSITALGSGKAIAISGADGDLLSLIGTGTARAVNVETVATGVRIISSGGNAIDLQADTFSGLSINAPNGYGVYVAANVGMTLMGSAIALWLAGGGHGLYIRCDQHGINSVGGPGFAGAFFGGGTNFHGLYLAGNGSGRDIYAKEIKAIEDQTDKLTEIKADTDLIPDIKTETDKIAATITKIDLIKTETDKIPAEVVKTAAIKTETDKIPAEVVKTAAIKTETDKIPAEVVKTAAIKTETDKIPATITKVDLIKTETDKTPATIVKVDAIKLKTDGLNFTGTDVKATLDGETVDLNADLKTKTAGTYNRETDSLEALGENIPMTPTVFLDYVNREVITRDGNGNPTEYKIGTGGNQKSVNVTWEEVGGIQKCKSEVIP